MKYDMEKTIMKKALPILITISSLLTVVSCNSFLDVAPEDKLTKEQIASSEMSINSVLNGIYTNMNRTDLYGAYLNKTLVDVLAQRYTMNASHRWYKYAQYGYTQTEVQNAFSSLWSSAYKQILDINDFIDLVNNTPATIPTARKNILLGEAYALRAFHHFDILRLFGPVYNTPDSTSLTMPYQNAATIKMEALLPANKVMDLIMEDLVMAEILLQKDPIITNGVVTASTNDIISDFYIYRNYRMNYYAVKAMQARVWLWRGNKTNALAAAKSVIDAPLVQLGELFQWLPGEDIRRGKDPDRVFSTEVIFGLEERNYGSIRPDMYTQQDLYFSAELDESVILYSRPGRLAGWFEPNDYRFQYIWLVPSSGGKAFRTFFKYNKPTSTTTATFAYYQPLIRITELYYIAAECEPTMADGVALLNAVRANRGLEPTFSTTDPNVYTSYIQNEYIREFYGEGQLFFYYKRKNLPSIENGSQDAPGMITMDETKYRVPLPLSESGAR